MITCLIWLVWACWPGHPHKDEIFSRALTVVTATAAAVVATILVNQ